MTEQELYDTLLAYFHERVGKNKNTCFMLVTVMEDEENITMGTVIIDPDLPAEIESPPIHRNTPQQVLIHLSDRIKKPLKEAAELTRALQTAGKLVGNEMLANLLNDSKTAEEFTTRINKELRK